MSQHISRAPPPLRRRPGFHLCPTFSPECLFSRINSIRALPWQTSRPIPLPRQERRQRPAPAPGDPSIFPARRERHLGAEERAPSLREGKERAAGSSLVAVPTRRRGGGLPGRLPVTYGRHLQAEPGRAGPAGQRVAEFADSKARRRRRAPRSAHERSPALPVHVAAPRPRSTPALVATAPPNPGTAPRGLPLPAADLQAALCPRAGESCAAARGRHLKATRSLQTPPRPLSYLRRRWLNGKSYGPIMVQCQW